MWKGINSLKINGILPKIVLGGFLFICCLLPLKHHLRWFTKQPYTAVVDKKISDFTPYPSPVSYTHLDVYKRQQVSKTALCSVAKVITWRPL